MEGQAGTGFSGARIFINYRREDSPGHAGWLHDRLVAHFGEDRVFMDLKIKPGENFKKVISTAVSRASAFLVVIGPEWLTVTDSSGKRRLENPADFVRFEITTALRNGITVIPLLVGNAEMPAEKDLPDDLQELSFINALELSDKRWDYDVSELITTLEEVLRQRSGTELIGKVKKPGPPRGKSPAAESLTSRSRKPASMLAFLGSLCFLVGIFLPLTLRGDVTINTVQTRLPAYSVEPIAVGLLSLILAILVATRPRWQPLPAGLLLGLGTGALLTTTATTLARLRSEVLSNPGAPVLLLGSLLVMASGIVVLTALRRESTGQRIPTVVGLLLLLAIGLRVLNVAVLDEWSPRPAEAGNTTVGILVLCVVMLGVALLLHRVRARAIVAVTLGFSIGFVTETALRALRFVLAAVERVSQGSGDGLLSYDARKALLLVLSAVITSAAAARAARAVSRETEAAQPLGGD